MANSFNYLTHQATQSPTVLKAACGPISMHTLYIYIYVYITISTRYVVIVVFIVQMFCHVLSHLSLLGKIDIMVHLFTTQTQMHGKMKYKAYVYTVKTVTSV